MALQRTETDFAVYSYSAKSHNDDGDDENRIPNCGTDVWIPEFDQRGGSTEFSRSSYRHHVPYSQRALVSLTFLQEAKHTAAVLLTIIPAYSSTYGRLNKLASMSDKPSSHRHEGGEFSDAQGYRCCQKAHENVSNQSAHGPSNCQCITGSKEETCSLYTACIVSNCQDIRTKYE